MIKEEKASGIYGRNVVGGLPRGKYSKEKSFRGEGSTERKLFKSVQRKPGVRYARRLTETIMKDCFC